MRHPQIDVWFLLVVKSLIGLVCAQNGYGSVERVFIFGISGLGKDYTTTTVLTDLSNFPGIEKMSQTGSHTLNARSSIPTMKLSEWSSILTGGGPEETGVYNDEWVLRNNVNVFSCTHYGTSDSNCQQCAFCKSLSAQVGSLVSQGYTKTEIIDYVASICVPLQGEQKTQCQDLVARAKAGEFNETINAVYDYYKSGGSTNEVCEPGRFFGDQGLCFNQFPPAPPNTFLSTFPSIFKRIKTNNKNSVTSLYTDWWQLSRIIEPNVIDYYKTDTDTVKLASDFAGLIGRQKPHLMVFASQYSEKVGKSKGWQSTEYNDALKAEDTMLLDFIDTLQSNDMQNTLVILVSTYGAKGQGGIVVPLMVMGPGVQAKEIGDQLIRTVDIMPTALYALGIDSNFPGIIGRPLNSIYGVTTHYPTTQQLIQNVLLIEISSLSSSAIKSSKVHTPNIDQLMSSESSSYSLNARVPNFQSSVDLPNWASLILGAGPEEHGVIADNWSPSSPVVPPVTNTIFPTFFEVVESQSADVFTAACWSNSAIDKLFSDRPIDYKYRFDSDNKVASDCLSHVPKGKSLVFVQLEGPQGAAQQYGFESTKYATAVQSADMLVGSIVSQITEPTLVILTSNHGDKSTTSCLTRNCMEVPFVMCVVGSKKQSQSRRATPELQGYVRTVDAASSILTALGYIVFALFAGLLTETRIAHPPYYVGNTISSLEKIILIYNGSYVPPNVTYAESESSDQTEDEHHDSDNNSTSTARIISYVVIGIVAVVATLVMVVGFMYIRSKVKKQDQSKQYWEMQDTQLFDDDDDEEQ